tara:strand:+ start:2481 stop:2726 length:246 start_codon:yes stop_codon:yes gene_type:complete
MTFFLTFLSTVLFLYVADQRNPSQLHFGKKCFHNEYGSIYSYVWVTRPNQELPANWEQCSFDIEDPVEIELPVQLNYPKPK